jgi:Zn-dependent protease with chaperone function
MYILLFVVKNNEKMLYSFGFSETSNFVSLIVFIKLYEILLYGYDKLLNMMIRKMEFKADEFAATQFNDSKFDMNFPHYLKDALIKAIVQNKKCLDPDPFYNILNNTHPAPIDRVNAIRNIGKEDKKENFTKSAITSRVHNSHLYLNKEAADLESPLLTA